MNITSDIKNSSVTPDGVGRLSYKFQRLRERLRQAVVNGELTGRLPGERELARRFKANPKTIGKALTDLAAEGLLERSIGRGTYVKGQTPQTPQPADRWLVIADHSPVQQALADRIKAIHGDLDIVAPDSEMRPSFLDRFTAAISLSSAFNQDILRDMLIRSFRILQVGIEPQGLMTHAILQDLTHGVSLLLRELSLSNHRNILIVGPQSQDIVSILAPLSPDITLQAAEHTPQVPEDITAVIALNQDSARQAHETCPNTIVLRGLGILTGLPVCPGYYISLEEVAILSAKLLADPNAFRPKVLWLSGARVDCLAPSKSGHGAPVSLSA